VVDIQSGTTEIRQEKKKEDRKKEEEETIG